MKRALVLALASCGSTAVAPPANTPSNHAPPQPPVASSTCFQRFGHTPPDNPPFGLRRDLDPVQHTIIEQLYNGSSTMRIEKFTVDGDRFAAHGERIKTEGQLVGAPWQWTSWTKTVTYTNGMSIRTAASITGDVLSEQTQVRYTNGQIEDRASTFKRVDCAGLEPDSKGPLIDI